MGLILQKIMTFKALMTIISDLKWRTLLFSILFLNKWILACLFEGR